MTQNGRLVYISGSALIILNTFEKKDSKSKSLNLTLGFAKKKIGNTDIKSIPRQQTQHQAVGQTGGISVKAGKNSRVLAINDEVDNPGRKNSSMDDKRFTNNSRYAKALEKSAESKLIPLNEKSYMESEKIQKSEISQLETDRRQGSPSFRRLDIYPQAIHPANSDERPLQNGLQPSFVQNDDKSQIQRDDRSLTIRAINFQACQHLSVESSFELSQKLLIPGGHYGSGLPVEVALIEISPDSNTVCVALNGIKSLIGFWSVDLWCPKNHLYLDSCSQILIARFSSDSKYMACIGINQKYTPVIQFIDAVSCTIVAYSEFVNFVSFRFKDIAFCPSNPLRFITVGMQHIASWRVIGDLMNFKELARSIEPDTTEDKNAPGQNRGSVFKDKAPFDDESYTVVKYISRKAFVAGSARGYIYLWNHNSYITSYCAFENAPISCIEMGPSESELLVSSCDRFIRRVKFDVSMNGFEEEHSPIEITLGFTDLKERGSNVDYEDSKAQITESVGPDQKDGNLVFDPALQIQSILPLENNNALIGLRNGTLIVVNLNNSKNQKYLLDLFDDEKPSAVEFSQDSVEVYLLTKNGQFYAYNIDSMHLNTKITTNKEGREILVVRDRVLLIMNKEIQIYDTTQGFSLIKEIRYNSPIIKAKVSADKYFLYVVVPKEEGDAQEGEERNLRYRITNCTFEIKAYEVENRLLKSQPNAKQVNQPLPIQQKDIFPLLWTYQTEEVILFDLSEDGKYMLIQTIIGEILIFEIGTQNIQAFDSTSDNFERLLKMKWMGEGITLSPDYSYLRTFYTKDSPVSSLVRLDDNCLAVADESGSVSL